MLKRLSVFIAPMVLSAAVVHASPVGYDLGLTTFYQFGGIAIGGTASPDTGFLTVQNNGASTYTGSLELKNIGGSFFDVFVALDTLNPGDSRTFASGNEGSNQGGFGPNGLDFIMNGTVSLGLDSEGVSLSAFDGDIHSGIPRVNPCDGMLSDSFVLQGGTPTGCDNGDGFEVTQAQGHAQFFEAAQTVPEPASMVLLGTGLAGALARRRRRQKG